MPRTPYTLDERRDAARRPDLANQVDMADIDTQFQGRRGDQRAQSTILQALLRRQTVVPRKAAMVSGDGVFADSLRKVTGEAFGEAACIDKYQGGTVRGDQCVQGVVYFFPHLVCHYRHQWRFRQLKLQITFTLMPGIDDFTGLPAGKKVGNQLDWFLGGGKPNSAWWCCHQGIQPGERQAEVAAPLIAC